MALALEEGLLVVAAAAAAAAAPEVYQTSHSAPLWSQVNHSGQQELGQELRGELLMVAMVVVRAWSLVEPRRLAMARLFLVPAP